MRLKSEGGSNVASNTKKIVFGVPKGNKFSLRNVKLKPLDTKPLFNGKDLSGWKQLESEFKQVKSQFSVTKDDNYNKIFPGHRIAMPPPLADDKVQYVDGTKATLPQEAHDVVTFLSWASDPHLEDRHRLGAQVMLFLLAFSGLMYGVKRKVWSNVHH